MSLEKVSDLTAISSLANDDLLLITKYIGPGDYDSHKMTVTDFNTHLSSFSTNIGNSNLSIDAVSRKLTLNSDPNAIFEILKNGGDNLAKFQASGNRVHFGDNGSSSYQYQFDSLDTSATKFMWSLAGVQGIGFERVSTGAKGNVLKILDGAGTATHHSLRAQAGFDSYLASNGHGNLGIGTTTPQAGKKLHVLGNTKLEGDLLLTGVAGTASRHIVTDASGNLSDLAKVTGWGTPTGTLTRTTFDTSTVTLSELAERVAALITDAKNSLHLLDS